MDAEAHGPAESEEANEDAESADKGWREAFFGLDFAILVELRFDYLVEVVEEWRDNNDCAEQNSRQIPQSPRPPIQDVGRACFG